MTVSALSPVSLQTFFHDNGAIVRPSRLFFFHPGTENPLTVYTDALLGVPHPHPVLSGGSGRVPPVYVGEAPYRVRVYDSYGSLIEDIDYLPGAVAPGEGGGGEPVAETLQTGDFVLAFTRGGARTGMVRANGGLIGPPGFAGTGYQVERLNADCHDLFVHLFENDIDVLTVVPEYTVGESAEDAWLANKAISVPDLRGSHLTGLDSLGVDPSGVLADVVFNAGSPLSPGAFGGSPFTTQTSAQMPTHTHGVLDPGHLHNTPGAALAAAGSEQFAVYPYSLGGGNIAETDARLTGITLVNEGGGEAMQTIGPFGLVAIYIKL